jgi:anti-sigma B factor antagonist
MKYDKRINGDIVIIHIREKKLISNKAPEMKTAFLGLMEDEGEFLIVNLDDVEYMDSTGLGSLLFGIRQGKRYDKDVVFCELRPRIKSLLHIAHLDGIFEVYDTEKEALDALQDETT